MLTSFHSGLLKSGLSHPSALNSWEIEIDFFWASDYKPTLVFRLLQIKEEVRTWECWPAAYSGALEKMGLTKNVFFSSNWQPHFQGPWKNWGWLNLLHLQELIVWDCKNIWIGYIRKTCWNCLHVELILWVGIWARTRPSCLLWWHWSTESGLFCCTRNLDQNCNKKFHLSWRYLIVTKGWFLILLFTWNEFSSEWDFIYIWRQFTR